MENYELYELRDEHRPTIRLSVMICSLLAMIASPFLAMWQGVPSMPAVYLLLGGLSMLLFGYTFFAPKKQPETGTIVKVKLLKGDTFYCSGSLKNVPNGTKATITKVKRGIDGRPTIFTADLIGEPGKDFTFAGLIREDSPDKSWMLTLGEFSW